MIEELGLKCLDMSIEKAGRQATKKIEEHADHKTTGCVI